MIMQHNFGWQVYINNALFLDVRRDAEREFLIYKVSLLSNELSNSSYLSALNSYPQTGLYS